MHSRFAVMAALKAETRALHAEAERVVRVGRADVTLADYRHFLEKQCGFHAPLEPKLRGSGVELDVGSKSEALARDLASLGVHEVEPCTDLPDVSSAARALGCLYVLEGASLGGQVLLRMLGQRLTVPEGHAFAYLTGYGARTGERWRAFGEAVERFAAATGSGSEVVVGALETFTKFNSWMRE